MVKTLLVLGGSSDIGFEYIKKYYDKYDIIVAQYCSHKEQLIQLSEELGKKLIIYQLNLLNASEIEKFLDFLENEGIKPNYILHLPAPKTKLLRVEETDIDSLKRDLDIQVISIIKIIKKLVIEMQEQKFGRICFMLSSVTENAVTFNLQYMISKYALLGAVKALAVELAGKKITVNAVSPSMINTKFIEDVPDLVKKKKISMNPMKRLAEPEDVIHAIEFFLDDANEYITGENLLIAGGGIIS